MLYFIKAVMGNDLMGKGIQKEKEITLSDATGYAPYIDSKEIINTATNEEKQKLLKGFVEDGEIPVIKCKTEMEGLIPKDTKEWNKLLTLYGFLENYISYNNEDGTIIFYTGLPEEKQKDLLTYKVKIIADYDFSKIHPIVQQIIFNDIIHEA